MPSDAAHLRTPSKFMLLEILRLGRNCCLETSEFGDRDHEITYLWGDLKDANNADV